MEQKEKVVTIKVFESTRRKIKILAAKMGITMQEAARVAIIDKMTKEDKS